MRSNHRFVVEVVPVSDFPVKVKVAFRKCFVGLHQFWVDLCFFVFAEEVSQGVTVPRLVLNNFDLWASDCEIHRQSFVSQAFNHPKVYFVASHYVPRQARQVNQLCIRFCFHFVSKIY